MMTDVDAKLVTREILLGFWKVHILHHAAEHPVVGQWILTELRRHGYDISPGTLYPLLKRMEQNGWLRSKTDAGSGPRGRRYYHLTSRGAAVLDSLRDTVMELYHEVIEEAAAAHSLKPVRLTPRGRAMAGGSSVVKPIEKRAAAATPVRSGSRRAPRLTR
jgi:DNA-binding PadR family transcriptional regulator